MPVKVAKTAGFCFGVERAVGAVEKMLSGGEKIATLGPIIHNPQVVSDFAARGVVVAENVSDIPEGYKAVIRSHGVEKRVYRELKAAGIPYYDTTCPCLEKIRKIAEDASACGKTVLIAGDRDHPEVIGIASCCEKSRVFSDSGQLKGFFSAKADDISVEKGYILLVQTTFNLLEWQKCKNIALKMCTNIKIFDTICNATMLRQQEAAELAGESDMMLIVGGRGSSNTTKLAEICGKYGPAFLIETKDELGKIDFARCKSIGITAGASTPALIIKEVSTTMSEILNQQEEQSFEEMLEQSFKTINSKEKVKAVVTNVSPNEIAVDIGTKHAGYVPLHEFTDDPNANLAELVKVGDELELMVLRVNDVEGTAMLSKKRLDAIAGFEKVMGAEESGEILEGVVVDVVKGGVIALTNGVRVFIPASQATESRMQELETLLKKPVSFKILETNRQRRRAVGSIRTVLREQRKSLEEGFWNEVEVGKTYKGTVKSLTSYGAFVDLGGVDGMVHISELSWNRIKHPSEVVKVDDLVEVYVKDVDRENKKISLGYKKNEDNPWTVLEREYKVGEVCKAKVVSMTPFGAFAQVIPGVDGLIHISQIATERISKPQDVLAIGQEVDVKITEIDLDKKRVSLSMRALIEPEERPAAEEAPQVYVAGPDGASGTVPEEEPKAEKAVEQAKKIAKEAVEKTKEVVQAASEKAAETAQAVAEKTKATVETVSEKAAEAVEAIAEKTADIAEAIAEKAEAVAEAVTEEASGEAEEPAGGKTEE